jgi:hypothetical protein
MTRQWLGRLRGGCCVEQVELFSLIIHLLEKLGVEYMVVGSYASGAYGDARFTYDIDIVADVTPEQIDGLIAELSEDFYISPDAALAAIANHSQFNIIHPDSGNKIDIMVPPDSPWGREQLKRRVRLEVLRGVEAFTASPDDVILSKMLYYREGGSEKHMRDITGILRMSDDKVDRNYISDWAEKLDVAEVWQAVLNRLK